MLLLWNMSINASHNLKLSLINLDLFLAWASNKFMVSVCCECSACVMCGYKYLFTGPIGTPYITIPANPKIPQAHLFWLTRCVEMRRLCLSFWSCSGCVCVCVCSQPSATSVMPKGRDYLKVLSVSQVWLIRAATNEDNTSHKQIYCNQTVTFEDICHIGLKCEIRQSWKEIHTFHNIWAPKLLLYLISESDWPFCLSF